MSQPMPLRWPTPLAHLFSVTAPCGVPSRIASQYDQYTEQKLCQYSEALLGQSYFQSVRQCAILPTYAKDCLTPHTG
jgi:hypothetical protein